MLSFFTVCFWTGVIFSVVSFFMGTVLGSLHLDSHFEGLHFHPHLHAETNAHLGDGIHQSTISPLKPIVITTFVTTFGGVGMMGLSFKLGPVLATVLALLAGIFMAYLVFRFIVTPLYRAQNSTARSQQDMIGQIGEATLPMKADDFGSISYEVNHIRLTGPAKSANGGEIAKGDKVVIVDILEGVFQVRKF